MRRSYRPILLAFITFLVNGLTYGQDGELNCGTFCLNSEATCTCTLGKGSLIWEVRKANGDVVGQGSVDEGDENEVKMLLGDSSKAFSITVISSTPGTFTSVLSFNTLSEYQGYEIECTVVTNSSMRTINIPGTPSVSGLNLTSFTTDSVVLAFKVSPGSDCVADYDIKTNANVSSPSINDASVTVSMSPNDAKDDTYSVCVTAVDMAGRSESSSSCLECFRFSRPNAVIFDDVRYTYMMSDDVCAAMIEWTPYNCLPPLTSYDVTILNSSAQVTTSAMSTTTFQISSVASEEEYTVTVIASNTYGPGMPASITFTTPMDCSVMSEPTSTTPTSGSTSFLFPGPGVLSLGVIAGFIASFGFSAIMF